jgi:hypothetical protein
VYHADAFAPVVRAQHEVCHLVGAHLAADDGGGLERAVKFGCHLLEEGRPHGGLGERDAATV